MRAAVIGTVGVTPSVVDMPVPERGRGDALVRISASALQPVDLIVASGRFYDGVPKVPFVPGLEAIGVIVEAETLARGARVRVEIVHPGYGRDGGCAEYVVVPEASTNDGRNQTSLQIVDSELPDELLAALGSSGATAWTLVEKASHAGVTFAGATVLVLGATGVVGEVLVQLVRHAGAARVIAAGRNVERLRQVRNRGADATVALGGRSLPELTEDFLAAAGGELDVVFDPLWGEPAASALDAIGAGGVLVNFGGSAGARAPLAGVPLRSRRVNIVGYSGARSTPCDRNAATRAIFAKAAAGLVTVHYEVVPLDEIASAWARQAQSPGGKLVIRP